MPRAPQYQPQIDRINPSSERLRAVNDGGGVAGGGAAGLQTLGRAGSQAVEAQDQINAHYDRITTRKRALEYRSEATALKMEFSQLEGEDALYGAPEYDKRLQELGEKYRSSVSSQRQRQYLSEQIDPFEAQTGIEMSGHLMGSQKKLHETTLQAELGEASQNAMGSINNPDAFGGYMRDVDDIIAEQADFYGWSPEIKQSMVRQAKSGIHSGVLKDMLTRPDSDLDLAVAYFDANMDEMTSADRTSIQSAIQGPLETRQAYSDFMEVAGGGTSSAAASEGEGASGAAPSPNVIPVANAKTTDNFSAHLKRGSAGNDFAAPAGTAIQAPAEGEVVEVGTGKTGGNFVRIRHADGTMTSYMHMQHPSTLKKGDRVTRASVIGTVGSTGNSSGPHLHMEVKDKGGRQIDPLAWLNGASPMSPPSTPRQWNESAIRSGIDAKVASGEWSFERGERAWSEAAKRMNLDRNLIAQREADAYEAAQEWLLEQGDNFRFDNMPDAVKDNLAPGNAITLKNVEDRLRGGGGKANGQVYTSMDLLSVENPAAFANTDITQVAGAMTPGEYRTLAKRQVSIRQKQNEWTPHNEVNSAFSRMTMLDEEKYSDKDKVAIKTLMIEAAYRAREENGGKPLTDKDYNETYRFALGKVQTRSSFGPFSNTYEQPRYDAPDRVERSREFVEGVEEVSRKRAAQDLQRRRAEVVKTFREEFGRAPNEAEIVHYLQFTP